MITKLEIGSIYLYEHPSGAWVAVDLILDDKYMFVADHFEEISRVREYRPTESDWFKSLTKLC